MTMLDGPTRRTPLCSAHALPPSSSRLTVSRSDPGDIESSVSTDTPSPADHPRCRGRRRATGLPLSDTAGVSEGGAVENNAPRAGDGRRDNREAPEASHEAHFPPTRRAAYGEPPLPSRTGTRAPTQRANAAS